MTLTEGTLQFTFNYAAGGRKFDGPTHGLSHCMKAVDFIVELPDRYLFVEVKDPGTPVASNADRARFLKNFKSGALDASLRYKFRDSFIYEWASGRADKPIDYFVLVTGAGTPELIRRAEVLRHKLPRLGPSSRAWKRPIVDRSGVFNIATWNKHFPNYNVCRVRSK